MSRAGPDAEGGGPGRAGEAAAEISAAEAGAAGRADRPDAVDEAGRPGGVDRTLGPLRVSTLELFFDLVFAFTLTQLTAVLADGLNVVAVARVLLIFGLLWWMYEGYAWLTNARPPVHATERLSLLAGMAGFLVVGLAIPRGFGRDGVTLGLGYLVVVVVHAFLYYRVNANIIRVAPFNIASALLIIVAGLAGGAVRYPLWAAALVIQLGSPLIVHPRNLFDLRPDHMAERHSALLIVALGESVAAIGIGAAALGGASGRVVLSSVLGLALAAGLWWIIFGNNDQERTEQALSAAPGGQRTALALNALFYGNVPVLLGLVAMATGVQEAIAASTHPSAGHPRPAAVLAVGTALFLTGDAVIRRLLGTGSIVPRLAGAVAALATTAAGALAGLDVQLTLLVAVVAVMLLAEQRWATP